MAKLNKEFVIAIGWVVFGIFMLVWVIPNFSAPLGEPASLLPALMAASVIILALIDAGSILWQRSQTANEKSKGNIEQGEASGSIKLVVISAIVVFAFAWTAEMIGFVLGAGISSAILLYAFGVQKIAMLCIIPVVFSAVLYFLFEVLLRTPLPGGWLFS